MRASAGAAPPTATYGLGPRGENRRSSDPSRHARQILFENQNMWYPLNQRRSAICARRESANPTEG
jgi:hypothetical protein